LVLQLLVYLCAGHVSSVVLPVGVTDRTVDLEQGRCLGLSHLALELLLIGIGGRGLNVDLDTGFLSVLRSQIGPLVGGFWFEIEVVYLALA